MRKFEEYFFLRDNPKGLIFERGRHIQGCGRFFNAARDTVSDQFYRTYKAGEPKPDPASLKPGTGEPMAQQQNEQEQTAQKEGFAE